MAGKAKPKDIFTQFKVIRIKTDNANSTTLVGGAADDPVIDTNLSIRGGYAWLIHNIEWWLPCEVDAAAAESAVDAVLCTVGGLAALPLLTDKGVISKCTLMTDAVTSGGMGLYQPHNVHFLPALPLAAPNIYLYAASRTNQTGLRDEYVEARLHITTIEMDNALYAELAEVWGY
jgi:hypothetical protein